MIMTLTKFCLLCYLAQLFLSQRPEDGYFDMGKLAYGLWHKLPI